jgi:hypothetical protein
MKRRTDILIDDKELNVENYNGKLPTYTIKALRRYRIREKENINKSAKLYYENNKEKVRHRQGKQTTLKRIMEGKNVSQKTKEKYGITSEDLEKIEVE